MWDVGNLFRYPRRYDQAFRERFAEGYREAGGMLVGDWGRTARLLDATRHLAALDSEQEHPAVFDDCSELLKLLVQSGE